MIIHRVQNQLLRLATASLACFTIITLAVSCAGSPVTEPTQSDVAPGKQSTNASQTEPTATTAAQTPVQPEAQALAASDAWKLPKTPVSTWTLTGKPGAYLSANLPDIETRTLSNGVKLIVKKNPANRVFSMKIAFRGGSVMTTPEKAGIEAMTLAMLTRGSKKYPYAELKRIQYEKSSSIGYTAASYDWASFDLNTIDKYWEDMFTVFSDCILDPAFESGQFAAVQNDFKVSIQKSLADPYNFSVTKLHDKMFQGHPYAAEFGGSAASISSLTVADIKKYYAEALTADRMLIVAVGNFDADALAQSLEKTLGTIKSTGASIPEAGRYVAKQALYLEKFDKSKGVAYVRGDYPIADVQSPDFVTLQLAYSMLDELLFSIVRTDHGACYSVWSRAFGFENPYGSVVVYKTDKPSDVKLWVDEAIAILASGKTMNLRGGTEKYAPLETSIDAYKAKYVNAFFGAQQTNAEAATQLASSQIYFGDHLEYLRFIDKINSIQSEDIIAVVKAYMVNPPTSWIIVSDQATLSKVDRKLFDGFTGKVE